MASHLAPLYLCFFSGWMGIAALSSSSVSIGNGPSLEYDGHGALSAGASSRLLFDYDPAVRSDILDYLFKPNFGANLHLIKVEIGGDGQSTDGTEASHMHYRDDLNCNRPYEFWLLEEAKKRNPDIKTYALSWAVPYWVGNQTGYFSDDNIDYHIKWLQCTKQYNIGNIDYIGNWNERPFGPTSWTKEFRAALDSNGFNNTAIIIPDGFVKSGGEIFSDFDSDPDFKNAVAGIGVHYPCNHPIPEIVNKYGKKFWSSEDYSTVGSWDKGAGCWGRVLNQNFIRMNQTSTIAWSLIWSVYPEWRYFGNGLMYAYWPWSGYYTVNGPIWTNAHSGQFSAPGWRMMLTTNGTSNSGFLQQGGSYLTMVSPDGTNFSTIVEKLEGPCLRCAGQNTTHEQLTLVLTDDFANITEVQFWSTNETHQFIQHPNIAVVNHEITIDVFPDTIYTISSWMNGQAKGATKIPSFGDFPLPYTDNFDSYPVDGLAKYLADSGGSFQIAKAKDASHGQVLKQFVIDQPGVNQWVPTSAPLTVIGNNSWTDIEVSVEGRLDISHPPPSTHQFSNFQSLGEPGMCADIVGKSAKAGTQVDLYSCVPDYNEQFVWKSDTLAIVGKTTGLCVASSSTLGMVTEACNNGTSPSTNAVWHVANSTVSNNRNECWTASTAISPNPDHAITLTTCNAAMLSQKWSFSATSEYYGVCVRVDNTNIISDARASYCLSVHSGNTWQLRAGIMAIASGTTTNATQWHQLKLSAKGTTITASINGKVVASKSDSTSQTGVVALQTGLGLAYFDNLSIDKI